jgi:hypothetical protein
MRTNTVASFLICLVPKKLIYIFRSQTYPSFPSRKREGMPLNNQSQDINIIILARHPFPFTGRRLKGVGVRYNSNIIPLTKQKLHLDKPSSNPYYIRNGYICYRYNIKENP